MPSDEFYLPGPVRFPSVTKSLKDSYFVLLAGRAVGCIYHPRLALKCGVSRSDIQYFARSLGDWLRMDMEHPQTTNHHITNWPRIERLCSCVATKQTTKYCVCVL